MTKNMKKTLLLAAGFIFIVAACLFAGGIYAETADDMVTATINYYYYDENAEGFKGSSPFPSFVAHMPKGSAEMAERNPVVPGFTPCDIDRNPIESVTVEFTEDSVTDIFYFPSEVQYVIRLNKQTPDLNGYDTAVIINGKGITGTEPIEFEDDQPIEELDGKTLAEAFEGFTLMYHVPEVIAADGSTEFECFYDRNNYLVKFELGRGGYGVDPIYAPYESTLYVNQTPVRAGYTFLGWSDQQPDSEGNAPVTGLAPTVTEDKTYYAVWRKNEPVPYTIIYKNADIDDGGETSYSYWGVKTLTADPDTVFTIDEIIAANKDNTELNDFGYFTFDEAATKADNPSEITVKGDGSTIIRFYYSRNKYKLRFVYLQHDPIAYVVQNPAAIVESGHQYLLVNTNEGFQSLLTNETSTYYYELNHSVTNSMLAFSEISPDCSEHAWLLTSTGTADYYYIQDLDGNYLTITRNTNDRGNLFLSDTPTPFYVKNSTSSDEFEISCTVNGTKYYLNDKSNGQIAAQGYKDGTLKDADKWHLFDIDGLSVVTLDEIRNIKAASGTGSGRFPGDANMNYVLPSMPEVDTSSGITSGSYIYNNKEYEYLELVAEFDANIEAQWPADVIGTSGNYSFGSWSTQDGTEYRSRHSTHANIVGAYPYMSSEMIVDPSYVYDSENSESVAQLLWAWWGKADDNVTDHRFNIYYEVLDENDPNAVSYNGVNYLLDRTLDLTAAHNLNTRIDPFVYKGFTIIPSEQGGHARSNVTETGQYQDPVDGVWTTEFHYMRNVHSIRYYNYNSYYDTGKDTSAVKYGQALSEFTPDTPPYPSDLKEGAYEFAGWYTTDTYDELFDWSETMPDNDITVYAYWKPKTFTVNFYNDESDYRNGNPFKHSEPVVYGTFINPSEAEQSLVPPVITSTTGEYNAAKAGWYYYDSNNKLHAFDPATMAVSGNMDLFMKWSSTVPSAFGVHYVVKNNESVKVADDTTGYSFVGLTRTFKAKVDDELNEGFKTNYFPDRSSTSILMSGDPEQNEKSFYYVHRDHVPYTVRYLEKGTDRPLLEDKIVSDNIYSVVTEKYVPINDYVPENYYQSLIVTVSDDPAEEAENNVIIFYYTEDTVNVPYHVKYLIEDDNGKYTQEIDGVTYHFKEAGYIDSISQRGSTKDITVNTYSGYEADNYHEIIYTKTDDVEYSTEGEPHKVNGASSVGMTLDGDCTGKELHIHYLKKYYPVKITYKSSNMNEEALKLWNEAMLAEYSGLTGEDPVEYGGVTYYRSFYRIDEDQKYNDTYTSSAKELNGFNITGANSKSIIVADDDSFTKNKMEFIYTRLEQMMFRFYGVIPNGNSRTIADPNEISLLSYNQQIRYVGERPTTVRAETSTDLYRFVGWYNDEACTQKVNDSLLSGTAKNEFRPLGSNDDVSYYALYDFKRGDLTVTTDGCDDTSQSFEYIIRGKDPHNSHIEMKICINGNGSKTIKNLPIGNYDVIQTDWSWRYTPDAVTKTAAVNDTAPVQADFTQTMSDTRWLDGNGYKDNKFAE